MGAEWSDILHPSVREQAKRGCVWNIFLAAKTRVVRQGMHKAQERVGARLQAQELERKNEMAHRGCGRLWKCVC
jgi:hypothetical protein